MATNKVKCLCGKELSAYQFILHITAIWKLNRQLTTLELQKSHGIIDEGVIISGVSRIFTDEEKAQATQSRKGKKR